MWGDALAGSGVGSSAEVCARAPLKVPKPLGLLQPGPRRSYRAQGLGLAVASQDGATGALGPSCPLGPRVPCLVPLAVDTVHSLPQEAGAEVAGRAPGLCDASGSAPRPASVDILHPRWLEVPRGTSRPLTAFSHRELPRATPAATLPSICPEATYSNVGLAARPVVWAGARLTSSHARPGPEAGPGVAEYACIQKLEGTDQGPQSLRQWKAEVTPAVQVDILYSRVKKPKKRDLGPATDQLDPKGRGEIPALGSDQAYETLPLRGLGMDDGLPDNVYETIQEMGAPEHPEPSGCSY
ncbi:lck-interacting transmembrane adapter 1 isoform X2 [Felis catus]|uniref:lck-interacting transmembrane adapter 1 isoform X2 n=1 Tax=Felis catus TaxID=9685 RepID=UPI0009484EE6|nr:lck-interacting transmembrane adapter 1 isoform X2 [Felis catus]